jgi:hypothetical protein
MTKKLKPVGMVQMATELMTESDMLFKIEFNGAELTAEQKTTFLAASLLTEYSYFEGNSDGLGGGGGGDYQFLQLVLLRVRMSCPVQQSAVRYAMWSVQWRHGHTQALHTHTQTQNTAAVPAPLELKSSLAG